MYKTKTNARNVRAYLEGTICFRNRVVFCTSAKSMIKI